MTNEPTPVRSESNLGEAGSRRDAEPISSALGRHRLAVIVSCAAILAAVVGGCHALLGGIVDQPEDKEVMP